MKFSRRTKNSTEIFQEKQNVLEHIKISRRAFSKFRKNTKYLKNGSNFPGDAVQNFVRTHMIFQEN